MCSENEPTIEEMQAMIARAEQIGRKDDERRRRLGIETTEGPKRVRFRGRIRSIRKGDKGPALAEDEYQEMDEDEQEQRETFEWLKKVLDEDRLSYRKLFPNK